MVSRNSNTDDAAEAHGGGGTDRSARLRRVLSTVSERGRDGTATALAGGLLLANAVRTARRDRRRAGAFALGGAVLLGDGLRQRGSEPRTATRGGGDADGEASAASAESRAHRERADVEHQSEANPRGVSGEPDVETVTAPDEGDIRFTTEQSVEEAEPKPHLDGHARDPRLQDEDDPGGGDGHVEVDLSEPAMADEASEAVGPADEQSYPAMEGTDPEPMSEKAPQRYGEGERSNAASDAAESDAEDGAASETDREDRDAAEQSSETETDDERES